MEYLTIGFCRWIAHAWFDYIQVSIMIGSVTPSGVDAFKSGDGLEFKFKFKFKYRLRRVWTSLDKSLDDRI